MAIGIKKNVDILSHPKSMACVYPSVHLVFSSHVYYLELTRETFLKSPQNLNTNQMKDPVLCFLQPNFVAIKPMIIDLDPI